MSAGEQLRIEQGPPAGAVISPPAEPPPPTPEQAEAIATRDRDVFLEAGAGTGKTGVLVLRYCEAVTEDGVGAERILAFTFTERAAGELRARIRAELARRARLSEGHDEVRARELWRLARDSERAWISTIHGFCRRLLAAHPVAAGLDPRFVVLDEAEAALVAERAFEAALEEVCANGDPGAEAMAAGFRFSRLSGLIRSAHEKLRSRGEEHPRLPPMPDPSRPAAADGDDGALTPAEAAAAADSYRCLRELLEAYHRHYERFKAERSGLDFEDLQLRAVRLLRDRPGIAASYRERFRHLMVDEFQDTNRLQLDLIAELRGSGTSLFTVGDEFQSIYGFRHADLEVFRSERRRAGAAPDSETALLSLRGNFRSRPEVLAAVNAVGDALLEGFEPLTLGKALDERAAPDPDAELLLTEQKGWDAEGIDLHSLADEGTAPSRIAEARFLAARLRELAGAGVPRGEMVVLLRAFTHVATYEEALERAGLAPYVVGGRGYWSHQQVEDVLRLLACVANPLDDESLFGALASPAVGVSPDALWLLRQAARGPDGRPRHVWPALERNFRPDGDPDADGWASRVPADDAETLRGFCERLTSLRSEAPVLSLEALTDRAAREFGYDLVVLMRERGRGRFANLRKLMRLARRFEAAEGRDLPAFLRYAEARAARDEREGQAATEAEEHDGVRIMTVHAAKGLEFGTVAVADLGRGLLAGGRPPDLRLGELAPATGLGPEGDDGGVPGLGLRLPRPGQKSITLWEFERLQEEAAEAEAAESRRLIYVAVSRARDRLLLSGTFSEGDVEGGEVRPSHSAMRSLLPALGVRAEGDPGEVEVITVPPAATRPGLDVPLREGRIAVRVNVARPEAARALVARAPAPDLGGEGIGANRPPPLLSPPSEVPAAGHLSYAALADYERCGYRFYVERVLGIRSPAEPDAGPAPGEEEEALDGEADLEADPPAGSRERRLGFGSAVHGLLEWSARNRWAPPGRERCLAHLRQEGLAGSDEEADRAAKLVEGWLSSPLRAELDAPRVRLRPEVPFVLSVGGTVVRGKMDLVAEVPGGGLVVVDYKTDALGDARPENHAARYAIQRSVYALAAGRGIDGAANGSGASDAAPPVRTVYCFLERPDEPVEHTFVPADLEAAREEVKALVAGVGAGRFEVTDEPHRALCHDCPARERLCSYGPERTMAALKTTPDQPVASQSGLESPLTSQTPRNRPSASARRPNISARRQNR